MRFFSLTLGIFLLSLSQTSSAKADLTVKPDELKNCSIKNYVDLVKCAQGQSADIRMTYQKEKIAGHLEDVAKQWVNPELNLESVSKNSDTIEQSATLYFNVSLGGKRSAKISEARAEYEKSVATGQFDIQNFRLSLMLALHKINHLQTEIKIEEESVATFSKIIKQYQGRAALSPEQDVSLSVFKMALADHQLSLVQLKAEFEKLSEEITVTTGLPKNIVLKNLPKLNNEWPEIESAEEATDSPQLRIAQSELNISKSLKSQAEAESWPDLKIGPKIQVNKAAGESETLTGVSLSMPLPVFSVNGGGREYSKQRLVEAQMSYDLIKSKTVSFRKQLVNKYTNLTTTLNSTLNSKSISEKHEKIEQQFFKGIVPSSLIIEAHRQLFDLESKRNESELQALDSLGQILILDNKFSEVIL
ncbi:hypothetical protein CIK05_11050 [Bdellovibrio sp. qaytius]|nr:hypothetical protein CIK05_11050 [Bdellovibrio sp. qaytius]